MGEATNWKPDDSEPRNNVIFDMGADKTPNASLSSERETKISPPVGDEENKRQAGHAYEELKIAMGNLRLSNRQAVDPIYTRTYSTDGIDHYREGEGSTSDPVFSMGQTQEGVSAVRAHGDLSKEDLRAMILKAADEFGPVLGLQGDDDFKQQIVGEIAELNLPIAVGDVAWDQKRQQLTEARHGSEANDVTLQKILDEHRQASGEKAAHDEADLSSEDGESNVPWFKQIDGYECLSSSDKEKAKEAYTQWKEKNPDLKYKLVEYVNYRQEKNAEESGAVNPVGSEGEKGVDSGIPVGSLMIKSPIEVILC